MTGAPRTVPASLAVIASRLLVGFLLDRVFAPRIAIAICLVAAAGILMFLVNGVESASITAIALGLALGAELDLMSFLIASPLVNEVAIALLLGLFGIGPTLMYVGAGLVIPAAPSRPASVERRIAWATRS